jgi:hypothetical protein
MLKQTLKATYDPGPSQTNFATGRDVHLVEAALATDKIAISLKDRANTELSGRGASGCVEAGRALNGGTNA